MGGSGLGDPARPRSRRYSAYKPSHIASGLNSASILRRPACPCCSRSDRSSRYVPDRTGESRDVPGRHEGSGDPILHRIDAPGDTRRHDGKAHCRGFERDGGQALAIRRQDEEVHRRVQRRSVPIHPRKVHSRVAPQHRFGLRRPVSFLERTDDKEVDNRTLRSNDLPGPGQLHDAFVSYEAADKAHDSGVWRNAESVSRFKPCKHRMTIGVESFGGVNAVHTAVPHDAELRWFADAFLDCDIPQRAADSDDPVCEPAG